MFVDPRLDREPSEARSSKEDVDESNDKELDVLSENPSPANDPARPTVPIGAKLTSGILARTTFEQTRKTNGESFRLDIMSVS